MRILHITPDYYPAIGGAEVFIKEASERLVRRGHDVTVLAMNSRGLCARDGSALPAQEVANGVTVRRLNNTYRMHERLLNVRGAHRLLSLLVSGDGRRMLSASPCSPRAFLRTLRADTDVVAFINWYHGPLAYQTVLARRLRNFALVGIPLFHTEYWWAHSPLTARMLAGCDAVVAMTDYEKRFVEERSGRSHAHAVGAGVDPSLFTAADGARFRRQHGLRDVPLVGYIGRISAIKGVTTLIAAMRTVWRHDPSVRLLLAGSGLPDRGQCETEILASFADLSSEERARLLLIDSFDDELKASMMDALDVFAMPSVAESFGMVYLEAWMRRKPVIGAGIPSTKCVIQPGRDGLLVAPESPDDLADAIRLLLSDPEMRIRMGQAGYDKTIGSFTWDHVIDRLEEVYRGARRHAAATSRQLAAPSPAA